MALKRHPYTFNNPTNKKESLITYGQFLECFAQLNHQFGASGIQQNSTL